MEIDVNQKTPFGGEIKVGTNMVMYLSARSYFIEHRGVEILAPYYYSTDTGKDFEISLKKFNETGEFEPECEICGEKLYKFRHVESAGGTLEQKTFVSQKKHSMFVTEDREVLLVCHGISRCFNKVGFEYEEEQSQAERMRVHYEPVSFSEWIEYETNDAQILSEMSVFDIQEAALVFEAMEQVYDSDVRPFMDKWGVKNLLKTNYMEFDSELETIKTRFLTLFRESERQKILKRILVYIGMK